MLLMKIPQELFFRGAYWGNFNYCNRSHGNCGSGGIIAIALQ